jgi:L-amino acid N-acyltransferase YncA
MVRVPVRAASALDLVAIGAIYADEVSQHTASFEIDSPDLAEIKQRWVDVCNLGLPYLVADLEGSIAGYAYAVPYRSRPAYCYTVEDSVYVAPWARQRGVGLAVLRALLSGCEMWGARQMVAIVGDPAANHASIRLHEKAGFRSVGTLVGVGRKFDSWLDSLILQRPLGHGISTSPGDPRGLV